MTIKDRLKIALSRHPLLWRIAQKIYFKLVASRAKFRSSADYWERRYHSGGNSGAGSFNNLARFKASVVNEFVKEHDIDSVIEHGCGDGNQLKLLQISDYTGVDISREAIKRCQECYAGDSTKRFLTSEQFHGQCADAALSMDVVYHLTEDEVFEKYMHALFDSARHFVIIYSSNKDEQDDFQPKHVRHRKFTSWVAQNRKDWSLIKTVRNAYPYTGDDTRSSFADFYFFGRAVTTPAREASSADYAASESA